MIVQNVRRRTSHTDMTFTFRAAERALRALAMCSRPPRPKSATSRYQGFGGVAKISVIGIGIASVASPGVAAQMFRALSEKGINTLAISTSEIKISVLIDAAYAETRDSGPCTPSMGSTRTDGRPRPVGKITRTAGCQKVQTSGEF